MSRHQDLKRLDIRTRNQLRSILSIGGNDAFSKIGRLKGLLGRQQVASLENVLASNAYIKGARSFVSFPKHPPFRDELRSFAPTELPALLSILEEMAANDQARASLQAKSLCDLDVNLKDSCAHKAVDRIKAHIAKFGWSHALLRRIVLIRETLDQSSDELEQLILSAGLSNNNVVVTSLVHAYASEQNFLTIKRSALNVPDRGTVNKYTRVLARVPFQPFAKTSEELSELLGQVLKCSLIDSLILLKLNCEIFDRTQYPSIALGISNLGDDEKFDVILDLFDPKDSEGEYLFNKRSSVWLEYTPIRNYRILIDNFYFAADDEPQMVLDAATSNINVWVGPPSLEKLVENNRFTAHAHTKLTALEGAGTVTRSAVFNYWLWITDGQIGLERVQLLTLMSKTRDLARTVPIEAVRNAVRISQDKVVRFVLLLLLAKRSKNEFDSFKLRRILEEFAVDEHGGSLVRLIQSYEENHPAIAEYIYDISTEDFLAKLKLAPHLSDIPELRANLHEWMASFTRNEYYMERARAVRVDHQLNRVRNEIDDHRIYVDPSRFWSWINDEVMIDLNSALTTTSTGKKNAAVSCDEALLSTVIQQCYIAFCSNAVFGIASYIGRRIRHGTFHGHLYSSVINFVEGLPKYKLLLADAAVSARWHTWKEKYDSAIQEIINSRLHVHSKAKQNGLLQPNLYSSHKLDILAAAVKDISAAYTETKTTDSLDTLISDYCWRLAEADLYNIQSFLKSSHTSIKQAEVLDDLISAAVFIEPRLAGEFKRELIQTIDKKLVAMYSWFKRPSNVAPKASLGLLYDAVVAEVRDSHPQFNPQTQPSPHEDFELVGGAYHVLYDSFFVVLSNAAKYADPNEAVRRIFTLDLEVVGKSKRIFIEIASKILWPSRHSDVRSAIEQRKLVDHNDANMYERKSGIPKLMQLMHIRKEFNVDYLGVLGDEVLVRLSYALAH